MPSQYVPIVGLLHVVLGSILLLSCGGEENETHDPALLPSSTYHYTTVADSQLFVLRSIYLPVYSDIYYNSGKRRYPLTVTASVRNVSVVDSLFVLHADYYDSEGRKKREYLKQPIALGPLASVEFVVEQAESEGGAGANFLIDWGAKDSIDIPVIQAVMIGTTSTPGISFVTDGVEITLQR